MDHSEVVMVSVVGDAVGIGYDPRNLSLPGMDVRVYESRQDDRASRVVALPSRAAALRSVATSLILEPPIKTSP